MLNFISTAAIPFIVLLILTIAIFKKVPIYQEFTEGAKDGFKVAINIIPYLVAIIVSVSMFRESGALEMLSNLCSGFFDMIKLPIETLPLVIVRSLSGGAALGVFSDIASHFGPDAYVTKLAAVMVGSSETTFYVLAVYFGSIGITKYRYALLTGVLADIIGIAAAILVCSMFFLPNIA